MEERTHEQTAAVPDRHYHHPVNPYQHSSTLLNTLLCLCAFALLALIVVGVFQAPGQFKQAGLLLAWAFLGLSVLLTLGIVGYQLWQKSRLDDIKRRHALADLKAKEQESTLQKEEHEVKLYLAQSRLLPDVQGNRPFVFNPRTYEITEVASGNYVQPVPAHQHLEYNYSDTSTRAGQERLAAPTAKDVEQPSLETIIEELHTNALEFVFGVDPLTGQLAPTTLPKSVHIQLLGASGQGKSRQATSILTQLCAKNDPDHLQLALVDCEGETTSPFQALPHVRYLADEPQEAARTFRGLVSELERRDKVRMVYPVMLIFVEEFLNLRRTMPAEYRDQALEDYTTLALRGRKRGMFLFSIGQTAYVERAIRDAQNQFLSSMAFAVKPTAARSAGFTNTDLLNKLYAERRPGQFLLERPAGDSLLLAPFVDPKVVPFLLSSAASPTTSNYQEMVSLNTTVEAGDEVGAKPETKPTEPARDARSQRVRDLAKQGVSPRQIIKEIWGVDSGSAYTKASQELSKIIAALL